MERQISASETGNEKRRTYAALISKYNAAIKYGFYLEALLIDYAMLEDRLSAFLKAAGVLNDTSGESMKLGNRRNKAQLKELYSSYTGKDNQIKLSNISCKINMLLALIDFSKKPYNDNDKYLSALHKGMQSVDLDKLSDALTALDSWREYRNEIIHAAMNKNIYSLYENLEERVIAGFSYARIIDNEARKLKRCPYIRKSANMPV